ncbi:MAG: SAVED domain-containing protein, partial [Myxococcota bacterium]
GPVLAGTGTSTPDPKDPRQNTGEKQSTQALPLPDTGPTVSAYRRDVIEPAASPSSATEEVTGEWLHTQVRPQDAVLVVDFQGNLSTPRGLTLWEELPCGAERIFEVVEPDLGSKMRQTPPAAAYWQQGLMRVKDKLELLKSAGPERVHLFFAGPHALALWLGQRLDQTLRFAHLNIYQFDGHRRRWELYMDTQRVPSLRRSAQLKPTCELPLASSAGSGVLLTLEILQHATESQLQELDESLWTQRVLRMQTPAPNTFLRDGTEAYKVVLQVQDELNRLNSSSQGAPLYLATSAPSSILVALGKSLRATVFKSLWCCGYDAQKQQYYNLLEIFSETIAEATYPRLEIVRKGFGLLYRLNGRLLEAVGNPSGGPRIEGTRERPAAELRRELSEMSEHLLPTEVEKELLKLPRLDIELRVTEGATELYWELLELRQPTRQPVLLREGWTLTRLHTPSQPPQELRPMPVDKLRVLIVPALPVEDARVSADEAEKWLQLKALEAQLKERGALAYAMPYGTTPDELVKQLKAMKPHVLHLVGHGMPEEGEGWPPVLELPGEGGGLRTLDATRLPSLLRDAGGELRLLILGACYSNRPHNGYGVPSLLMEYGVGAVIGYREAVGMGALQWFSTSFYESLLAGARIRDAVQEARHAIQQKWGGSNEFAAPLLIASSPTQVGALVQKRV